MLCVSENLIKSQVPAGSPAKPTNPLVLLATWFWSLLRNPCGRSEERTPHLLGEVHVRFLALILALSTCRKEGRKRKQSGGQEEGTGKEGKEGRERDEMQKEKEEGADLKVGQAADLSTRHLHNHRCSLAVGTSGRLLESYRVCWLALKRNWVIREEGTLLEKYLPSTGL